MWRRTRDVSTVKCVYEEGKGMMITTLMIIMISFTEGVRRRRTLIREPGEDR